jgi:hypothetical protein
MRGAFHCWAAGASRAPVHVAHERIHAIGQAPSRVGAVAHDYALADSRPADEGPVRPGGRGRGGPAGGDFPLAVGVSVTAVWTAVIDQWRPGGARGGLRARP